MMIFESTVPKNGGGAAFCALTFNSQEDRNRFDQRAGFRGEPLGSELLIPYRVVRSAGYPGEDTAPLGDRQGIGYYVDPMVLSRRALDVLLPRIGHLVQLVPLQFNEGEYAAINITHVIDALDEARSDIERFPSSGRISRILRHAFKPDRVKDELIFKIPQTPRRAFVTDRFVKLVNDAGLTGFAFEPIWSDATCEPQAPRPQGSHPG
jgi:hypothetical protein